MIKMATKPDLVVMSSKGQVVVPSDIRQAVKADAGTEFIVYGSNDTIIFKKVQVPRFSIKELEKMVIQNEKKLRKAGYTDERQVKQLIEEAVQKARSG